MKYRSLVYLTPAAFVIPSAAAFATQYLTVEQARELIFPARQWAEVSIELTPDQEEVIEDRSDVRVRERTILAWRSRKGEILFLDKVLGKHEFITYVLGVGADGSVKGIEILDYRETYGDEIRDSKWRAQFSDKTVSDQVVLTADIEIISGATLSCRHITDGVRRLLFTHQVLFANASPS